MSMPQPIHVALVGSTTEIVQNAKRHFRLGDPGIGPVLLAALNAGSDDQIKPLSELPHDLIDLWVALDHESYMASQTRHHSDSSSPRYSRGFYNELLPEPCVIIEFEQSPEKSKLALNNLVKQIVEAWYATS